MEAKLILANKTMSSMEIAELTERNHKDVMRSIRDMEPAWVKINGRNFALVEYRDAKGEMRPMYQLTKTECLYVATKFNDEARAKLVIRWEQLENERRELSRKELAMMVLQAEEERERLLIANTEQQKTIEAQAPKVLFADSVSASKTSILIGDLAKILKQNGVEIGSKRLFDWMRRSGYLIKQKGLSYNMPTQKAMNLKLFEIKETVITHSDGHTSINKTVKVTGNGQIHFVNKFLNRAISSISEIITANTSASLAGTPSR